MRIDGGISEVCETYLPETMTTPCNKASPAKMAIFRMVILLSRAISTDHAVGMFVRVGFFFIMASLVCGQYHAQAGPGNLAYIARIDFATA